MAPLGDSSSPKEMEWALPRISSRVVHRRSIQVEGTPPEEGSRSFAVEFAR